MPKYLQTRFNMRIKLFYNDMIRYSATRSRRKLAIANTRSERDDVQRRSDCCKPGDPCIGLKVHLRGGSAPFSLICMCWPSLKAVPRHVALVETRLTRATHWCRSRDFRLTYKGETTLKISDFNRSSGRTKIGNRDCRGGGMKKEEMWKRSEHFGCRFWYIENWIFAVLHVKIVVDDGC